MWKIGNMETRRSVRVGPLPAFLAFFGLAVTLGFGIGAAYAASWVPEPAHNIVMARLPADLDARNTKPGERLALEVVPPFPNGDPSYEGASVKGHLTSIVPPAGGKGARVNFVFDEIVLSSGAVAPIAGHGHARAGDGLAVGNILGKWVGLNSGNDKGEFVVPRGSTVRVQVDETVPHPTGD